MVTAKASLTTQLKTHLSDNHTVICFDCVVEDFPLILIDIEIISCIKPGYCTKTV